MTTIVELMAALIFVATVIIGQARTYRGKPLNRILIILALGAALYLFFVPESNKIRDAAFAATGVAILLVPMLLFDRDVARAKRKRESEGRGGEGERKR